MSRFRLGLAALVVMMVPLTLMAGVTTSSAGVRCTDHATDMDTEYAGDVDVWCVAGTTPTPSSSPSPVPSSLPSPTSTPPPSAPGAFPVAYFAPDFSGPATRQFSQQFITQVGGYLQVTYPAGSSAPSSGHPGGAQASLRLAAGPVDSATLTYNVRFPVGFQFVKGGKLPGLCGGQCWTGSNNGPGGWATRFMWRANGAAEVLLSDATTSGSGTDLGRGTWTTFRADGQWHTLTQTIHLNSPGLANGSIDATYNGVTAHFGGITFRAAADGGMHIDSLMFSTFFGGHDSSWAPSTDQHIDFASFRISRSPASPVPAAVPAPAAGRPAVGILSKILAALFRLVH